MVLMNDEKKEEKKDDKKADDGKMTDVGDSKAAAPAGTEGDKGKKEAKTEKEMSEEDKKLKEALELLVTVITEPPASAPPTTTALALQRNALISLQKEIRSSTSSMTSIPKPLKFLKPHYATLVAYHKDLTDENANKAFLADVLSVLAMTQGGGPDGTARETLRYKLVGEKDAEIGVWGHEYVRHLAGEVGKEYAAREEAGASRPFADLDALVHLIVPFFMEHNAEYDAVDMLIEVEQLSLIQRFLTRADGSHATHQRVCQYISKCAEFIIDRDEQASFHAITFDVYLSHDEYAEALRVAIRMHSEERMERALQAAEAHDLSTAKQLCYILGQHRIVVDSYRDKDELNDIMGNVGLSAFFHQLASDLDVKEAKTPEDIYKTHLEEGGTGRRPVPRAGATASTGVDSAKQNLASSFVNAFVNCAFGKDLLITPEGSDWLYKNKSHGMMSATASLGLLMLWDVESGFSAVDKYSFSTQAQIKAGTALAHGLLSTGVTSDMDAALALLSEHIEVKDVEMKVAAIFGLGMAYCNTARAEVLELLVPLIVDETQPMEVVAHACLSLGLVYCGTASEDISGSIIEAFLDRSDTDLRDSTARLMCLTGDHMVLTSSGWRSIKQMRVGDDVMSFNTDTWAMEWKPVTRVVSYDVDPRAAEDTLYRMHGDGMDVIATRDHRMLLARTDQGEVTKREPIGYETVGDLLDMTYTSSSTSKVSQFEHSQARAVLCAGLNRQPAVELVIPGLERVCDWWWNEDQQRGFLQFIGLWLGDGHLEPMSGCVVISQKKPLSSAWLVELLDDVFPRWWCRRPVRSADKGTECQYNIRCPPLCSYLSVMAVGPLGYNPRDPSELRSYPHFTKDQELAQREQQHPYYRTNPTNSTWTEDEMLAAMTDFIDSSDHDDDDVRCSSCAVDCRCEQCVPLMCVELGRRTDFQLDGEQAADAGDMEEGQLDVLDDDEAAQHMQAVGAVVWWNNGQWIVINGRWYSAKRWLGAANVANTFSRLSREQAVALLDGFCRAGGEDSSTEYDEAGNPTGCWEYSSSSFPLIDHLTLIAQLAEARVTLDLHPEGAKSTTIHGRAATVGVDHWQLSLVFNTQARAPMQTAPLNRPVDVSDDIAARGYYEHEDDGKVYCIEVEDNKNFLTQRLAWTPLAEHGGGLGVRARPCFTGNCLGMGLLFLNRGSDVDPALTALKVLEHPIVKYLELTVSTCAYVGIASPLEIQKHLTTLLEHIEEDEKDALKGIHQEVAVLGVAMVSMTEELTAEMALRSLDHILQYAEVNVRRVVPLALGLLSISNPRLSVMDTLSKLSHDGDQQVSQNAVFSMGLVGAGTNNSRIAATLRSLASYYSKEPNHLFLVRIAQGLLHLGKGLMTLAPVMSDGFTLSRASMSGLLVLFHAALDMKNSLLSKRHYLLYALAASIRPRMLMTLNEQGESIAVQVRVGQRVDTTGQAGKPKSITGFQTHKTPVLISAGERAELATDEYIPLTNVLEGFVILKKNPNYRASS